MASTPALVVADAPERHRYEATLDGSLAGFAEYTPTPTMLVFTHTEVLPAHEGAGVGSAVVRFALDDVRERGLKALAVCPFVLGWIQRHPAYTDLEYRSRTRPDLD
ncbi:GNAT family N-acetyltransferase [Aquipuribacter hungaricus]|uniref:GNAT family N-acetyltransferase n=1 Tax=Aquipuribacter hungaricus TaxID=545624 RepID=A0ABV7WM62_9MICO